MPTQYMQSIHDRYKIPIEKLEEYWEKAKRLAAKRVDSNAENYYAYVTGIFKNSLSLSQSIPQWWKDLPCEGQEEYLKEHPKSARKILKDCKIREVEEDPKHLVSLKGKAKHRWNKARGKVVGVLSKHRKGLSALGKLLSGGSVSESDYEKAKNTAALTASLVVGSLVALSMFTPLAPITLSLAEDWLADMLNSTSSEKVDEEDSEKLAYEMSDRFYEWLMKQDIDSLIAKHKENVK
jgi:hypothetical protein